MTGILMASVGNSYGAAPVNTVAPAVTGTASFGSTLTTTNGTWTGAPAPTFTYQWFRSPSTSISGATSSTYVLVAADVGFGIFCQVTATNSIAPSGVTANSNTTATVVAVVPGAPTIGTATATGSSTATVAYTAPASNGGATITVYTATSSPGSITGTLSQAGSGTITVSGLTASTSYTFTVTATNSAGTSSASAASNSITTSAVTGQQAFTTCGDYSWVAPTGVTSVSAVVVGAGGGGVNHGCEGRAGGGGGALAYLNNYGVTPGNSYTVGVGGFNPGTNGGASTFINSSTLRAGGGRNNCLAPGVGGRGGLVIAGTGFGGGNAGCVGGAAPVRSGGGGAGGYAGAGGAGQTSANGCNGTGGSGGGGSVASGVGGSGGGVGILGQGSNGAGGIRNCATNRSGTAGSGGSGVLYGGGGSPTVCIPGGGGATRIIWPGTTRSFPSTNTGDL